MEQSASYRVSQWSLALMAFAFLAPNEWFGLPDWPQILLVLGSFFVGLLILTVVFYVSGLLIVGEEKARFSDALIIALLGLFIGNFVLLFLPALLGLIAALIVWLLLIRHFYETGWLKALAVAILAVVVFVAILVALALMLSVVKDIAQLILPWI